MAESTAGPGREPLMPDPWAFQRWAFQQETGASARKAVLLALAVMADAQTGRCEAKHETIAQWVEASRRSVIRHIEGLRQAGLVATRRQYRGDGARRGDEFLLLAPWVSEWPDGERIQGANRDLSANLSPGLSAKSDTSKVPNGAGPKCQALSQQERPLKNDHLGNERLTTDDTGRAWADLAEGMREDAVALLKAKRKVGSRLVSEREMVIATLALAEFNRLAPSSFSIGPWLDPIVRRAREHPSYDVDAHVRLVQSLFRIRWWEKRNGAKRRATPKVLWGNEQVFENVVQDAVDEARALRELASDFRLDDKVWPDGRRWEQLTPREQHHAREAVLMGRQPWLRRDLGGPVRSGGVGVTPDNILSAA